jgi:SPP1 gp7 family putative phage head morphogenesis protein
MADRESLEAIRDAPKTPPATNRKWKPSRQAIKFGRDRQKQMIRAADPIRKALEPILRANVRAAAARVRRGQPPMTAAMRRQLRERARKAIEQRAIAVAVNFAQLSTREVPPERRKNTAGKSFSSVARASLPVEQDHAAAGRDFTAVVFLAYGKAAGDRPDVDELILDTNWAEVKKFAGITARYIGDGVADRLERIMADAESADGITGPAGIARRLRKEGLVDSRNRAERIARTMASHASNAGTLQGYRAMGVGKKMWLTAVSAESGTLDLELNGTIVPIDEQFTRNKLGPVLHPPLHPNCRCTIIPALDA